MSTLFENYKISEVTNTKRIICTPPQFTKNHFFYIQEAGYLKSLKPHLSRRSGLHSFLFMVVLSGSGTVTYHDAHSPSPDRVHALAGDCFYINCMNEYTHISSDEDPWELVWIHFDGPQAQAYYDYFTEHNHWHFHPDSVSVYTDCLQAILSMHQNRNENTDILVANQIQQILTNSCTAAGSDHTNASSDHISNKLQTILHYLDEHYTENPSLDFLAEHFFVSKYYLSREFKKEYGTTIIQYILTKKITHAKELLRYSNSSIEDIALLCGIGDASYFNKIFKKLEGCTASEYRKRW